MEREEWEKNIVSITRLIKFLNSKAEAISKLETIPQAKPLSNILKVIVNSSAANMRAICKEDLKAISNINSTLS